MKKCKVCKTAFKPASSMHSVCSPSCAIKQQETKRAKADKMAKVADRRETKARLERLKRRGDYIEEAQTAFNSFIRERDRAAGYACISSGRPLDWAGNSVDAGHYRSRGSAPHLRFDERNCHAQSKHDNRYAAGNMAGYRLGLIERLGIDAVEALEADQQPRKYTTDELVAIKLEYAAKARKLKKERESCM